MASSVLVKVPERYRPLYVRARERQRRYREKGVDVALFTLMDQLMSEEREAGKGFKGFKL